MADTTYKRLKLDKFVAGKEQRIFKTTTIKESTNPLITQKDVFYGEYSSAKLVDVKTKENKLLSGDLINFHDINCDYIINRPDKTKVLSFNRKC